MIIVGLDGAGKTVRFTQVFVQSAVYLEEVITDTVGKDQDVV